MSRYWIPLPKIVPSVKPRGSNNIITRCACESTAAFLAKHISHTNVHSLNRRAPRIQSRWRLVSSSNVKRPILLIYPSLLPLGTELLFSVTNLFLEFLVISQYPTILMRSQPRNSLPQIFTKRLQPVRRELKRKTWQSLHTWGWYSSSPTSHELFQHIMACSLIEQNVHVLKDVAGMRFFPGLWRRWRREYRVSSRSSLSRAYMILNELGVL